ncbi:hypothetical protein [Sphingomonas sp.]|uniref:hypothetical protein n=1 Tax=Sphingomonas sp. TaxID=28214 RepID=UPI003D6D18D0
MTIAEDLKSAIQRYDRAVKDGMKEAQIDTMFEAAENLVPNARLSELYFYGERERSHDEVVEEALYREELWERGGDRAVLLYVQAQAKVTMDDPTASITFKVIAEQVLSGIDRELEEFAGRLN